jgi:hypothetical protein
MSPRQQYQATNLEVARLILSDVALHGGPDSLMAQWARLVIEKSNPQDAECGPLFAA